MSHRHAQIDALVDATLGAFYEVYNTLGYGFLEVVYARALEHELRHRNLEVAREVLLEARYKGMVLGVYRADLIVCDTLVVEVKATAHPRQADRHQLMNYLRAGALHYGLLLQFAEEPRFWRVQVAGSSTRRNDADRT